MGRLRGPKPPVVPFVPPDLGLSAAKADDLEIRVRQLLYRWQPMTSNPDNLVRDVYALIAWVLEEEDPTCPRLIIE
jgi:hypothetical protein